MIKVDIDRRMVQWSPVEVNWLTVESMNEGGTYSKSDRVIFCHSEESCTELHLHSMSFNDMLLRSLRRCRATSFH
jgi:hypothetical protein